MNIFGYITSPIKAAEERKEERLRKEARHGLNVREFNGKLYIAVEDTPLLDVESLKIPLHDALDEMRKVYVEYNLCD